MNYFILTIIYALVFWLVFKFFLSNKPMHRFNRFYLLLASLLPFVLPIVKINNPVSERLTAVVLNIKLKEFIVSSDRYSDLIPSEIPWLHIIYLGVSLAIFLVLVKNWIKIIILIRKSEKIERDGYSILLNTGYGPGSWGRYIFLPADVTDKRIIEHECTHIRLRHSLDIMLLSLLHCAFWYNPFNYLFRKELKMVHEYQADAAIAENDPQYSELLLSSVFSTSNLHLTNSFIHHPIKKRIMMFNNKINKSSKLFRSSISLIVIAVFASCALVLQSFSAKETAALQTDSDLEQNNSSDQVFTYVERMPEFPGDLTQFLIDNLVYPKYAQDNKIEGRVILKFVIDRDGNVINKQVVKSPHDTLSQAALEVLDMMPKWTPGEQKGKKVAVSFTLPVSFKLK